MIFEGTFLPYKDQPNGNGRIYNNDSIDSSCFLNYFNKVTDGLALGESTILSGEFEDIDKISLTNVSHKVIDLTEDTEGIKGAIELLATPAGQFAKQFIDAGGNISVRPRMTGSIHIDGSVDITHILSFDIISEMNDAFNLRAYKNKRPYLRDRNKRVIKYFHSFDNLNIFLEREKQYNTNGRLQTEDQAKQIDKELTTIVNNNCSNLAKIPATRENISKIVELIEAKLETSVRIVPTI